MFYENELLLVKLQFCIYTPLNSTKTVSRIRTQIFIGIYYIRHMTLLLILYIVLIAFVTTPGVFFRVPLKRPVFVALAHGTLFFICFWVGSRFLTYSREGYASNVPIFKDPKFMYEYCMENNRPPFIGSIEDAENHCLSRIAGSGYQPELKNSSCKKVTFAVWVSSAWAFPIFPTSLPSSFFGTPVLIRNTSCIPCKHRIGCPFSRMIL